MPKGYPLDLVGKRFSRLVVVCIAESTASGRLWYCVCDCGGTVAKYTTQLRRAVNIGCRGCETKSRSDSHTKHGGTKGGKSQLYMVWKGIHSRCRDPGNTSHRYYGGKGVRVCSEWNRFEVFRSWALANGYAPGLSIDRINPDEGYGPPNCEFITRSENTRRMHAARRSAAENLSR